MMPFHCHADIRNGSESILPKTRSTVVLLVTRTIIRENREPIVETVRVAVAVRYRVAVHIVDNIRHSDKVLVVAIESVVVILAAVANRWRRREQLVSRSSIDVGSNPLSTSAAVTTLLAVMSRTMRRTVVRIRAFFIR